MPTSDQELLEQARAGGRDALERLLERHQRRVFRFGMKMCGEEEDAKDVLQETLIAAARGIRDFRGASSVSTWLYTIARSFASRGTARASSPRARWNRSRSARRRSRAWRTTAVARRTRRRGTR